MSPRVTFTGNNTGQDTEWSECCSRVMYYMNREDQHLESRPVNTLGKSRVEGTSDGGNTVVAEWTRAAGSIPSPICVGTCRTLTAGFTSPLKPLCFL